MTVCSDDDQAVVQRHRAAVERVGLDRVDRAARPPARDQDAEQAEHQAAQRRHQERPNRLDLDHAGQALPGQQAEQQFVDVLGDDASWRRRPSPAPQPTKAGERDEPDLVGADQRPQGLRRVMDDAAEGAPAARRAVFRARRVRHWLAEVWSL